MGGSDGEPGADHVAVFRRFLGLERDVLVLSIAMLVFSLSFQMTSRYLPEYIEALGGGALAVGAFGSLGNLISAVYPYPGGAISDRIGSRSALTVFATVSTMGFVLWAVAPSLRLDIWGLTVPAWGWVFVGLLLAQAWKSFGLGATFAIVKQATRPDQLATGFASTETFRRIGFLIGPLVAAVLLAWESGFVDGFQNVLWVGVGFAILGTITQHALYDASADSIGRQFEGIRAIIDDLRSLPEPLYPLLVADTLIRFANGMVYVFFVLVITKELQVGLTVPAIQTGGIALPALTLRPDAFFGILLAIEMAVALVSMVPMARLSRRIGLKPVVALGFAVYALFPVLLISAPANALIVIGLFAFSGLRFAGLPAHKALIVGPAQRNEGGRVTGAYYLARNTIVIPSAALGGVIYSVSPTVAFGTASAVGVLGVALFLLRGQEFEPAIAT